MDNKVILEVKDLYKSFFTKAEEMPVLKGISFTVEQGTFLTIIGPSGCGKSTLLHSILGLEEPTKGNILVFGEDLYSKSEKERTDYRKYHIGMVYQQSNWIKSLSLVENVAFPLLIAGYSKAESVKKALEMIVLVHMYDWREYNPVELSSGQQQKAALARAMITHPEIIVADEPTGSLDFKSGQELISLIQVLHSMGKTILMVTHDLEYVKYSTTVIKLFNGQVVKTMDGKEKEMISQEMDKEIQESTGAINDGGYYQSPVTPA